MDQTRIKFFATVIIAGTSVIVMALANKGFNVTPQVLAIVVPLLIVILIIVLLVLKRKTISFFRNLHEKQKEILDEPTRQLCGFSRFTAYSDYIIFESSSGKMTGHAYVLLEKLPYMIEEMTRETQMNIVSSFSRLLGKFNHPFTYMPICRPVDRTKFTKDLQHKIHNLRIAMVVSKVPDPKQEIEEKRLNEQLKRLTEGESPIEILFVVQIRETAKSSEEIKNQLNLYSKSMINNLEVIHQVRARRLSGVEMTEAIQAFFMLEA